MEKKIRKMVCVAAAVFVVACICNPQLVVYAKDAADGMAGVTEKFDSFENLLGTIISSVGTILCLWQIFKFGMALQGNDGVMQAHAFGSIAGAFLMVLAPQILPILA